MLFRSGYRGGAPAVQAVLANETPMVFQAASGILPHIRSGSLRALAVATKERSPLTPEIPTFAEQGFGEAQVMSWYTIAVRAGTPTDIVGRIHAAALKTIAAAETRERLEKASCEIPAPRSPAEVQALYAADFARYGRLVKEAGIVGET